MEWKDLLMCEITGRHNRLYYLREKYLYNMNRRRYRGGIHMTTPQSKVDEVIRTALENQRKALIYQLQSVGEQAVNTCRTLPSPPRTLYWNDKTGRPKSNIPPHQPGYIDWTANLRSSIGYVIVDNGKIVSSSSFEAVTVNGETGTEGAQKGRAFAEELASRYSSGLVLIVVAGMHYAKYIQRRGYDVLISGQILAENLIQQLKAA